MIDIRILVKLWPFLSATVIGLGAAKIVLFYHSFDISIIQYLDFSKVFILFFDDILFFTVYLIIPIIILALFIGHRVSNVMSAAIGEITNYPTRLKRLWGFFKMTSALWIYFALQLYDRKVDYPTLALLSSLLIAAAKWL